MRTYKHLYLKGDKTMEEEIFEGIIENDVDDVNEETDNSGVQTLVILGVGALAIGAGLAAWLYTQRDKIEQKKVERLRKKGYVIYKPESIEDSNSEEESVEHFEGKIEED